MYFQGRVKLGLSEYVFWNETTPRVLIALIDQNRKAEIETAIVHAYGVKIENPADLRETDRQANSEAAWDNMGF